MSADARAWVADKLVSKEGLRVLGNTEEGFIIIGDQPKHPFLVAVLGKKERVEREDVEPLFGGINKPSFVVNIPSKAIWTGGAINFVHQSDAAFGSLGEVKNAYFSDDPGSYRNKVISFYTDAFRQHSNVVDVSFVFRNVLRVERRRGRELIIAIIESYNMSAEDIRTAKRLYGHFDIALKSTSYGGITSNAITAAASMEAEALMFGQVLAHLAK